MGHRDTTTIMRHIDAVFSHITLGTADIGRATGFYDAVLAPLGLSRHRSLKIAAGYAPVGFSGIEPPFWIVMPHDRNPASAGNGVTVAFEAKARAAVDPFYAAGVSAGGRCEGAPGVRSHYHPDFYAAYVRDPDGNKLCVVCHAPASAAE